MDLKLGQQQEDGTSSSSLPYGHCWQDALIDKSGKLQVDNKYVKSMR
jgi:hypothetical protein